MATKVFILLGKSGSGKGTQAELLQEKFKLDYIGSGDLLRARAKKKDYTGKNLGKVLNGGKLAPTAVILKLWLDEAEKLKNKKNLKGLIMDGNPRKILEAKLIDEALDWYEWNAKVFLIDISNKEATWRLTKRRICKKCKNILPFVGEFRKMKECPECKGQLVTRKDDNISSVKKRLDWFKKEVHPIIDYYKKEGKLIKINGEQPIDKVFRDILKHA